ncbi:MAG: arsenite efflux transporter metallochaperone ArsD [Isosphaeraceae bacterium]
MTKLAVYDPPMCCSTGVCGPSVDPALPRFAADLDWLKRQGVQVERYNLAQQAAAFASNPVVREALREFGNDCLPLLLVDGRVAAHGRYPSREELSRLTGLSSVSPADADSNAARSSEGASCPLPPRGLSVVSGCCAPDSVQGSGRRSCC